MTGAGVNKKLIILAVISFVFSALLFAVILKSVSSHREAAVSRVVRRPDTAKAIARDAIASGRDIAQIAKLDSIKTTAKGDEGLEMALSEIAGAHRDHGDLLKAHDLYQKLIEKFPTSDRIVRLQADLDDCNIRLLFSPIATPDSFVYEVQKGDSLARISKRFATTKDLIMRANRLSSIKLRVGHKLKITKDKFSIMVDKSQNILTLKADGAIVKTYRVSTGKDLSTPAGTFKIVNRIENPTWYTGGVVVPAGDPKNILGTRWLGITAKGYGIHGTTEPESIGKNATAGCVRMRNGDIEELFAIVPEGTPVTVIN